MSEAARSLLRHWILRQTTEEATLWLESRLAEMAALPPDGTDGGRRLALAFGRVPRIFGREDLALSPPGLAAAQSARPGWDPAGWSIDGAARVLLLLHLPIRSGEPDFARRFRRLRQTADPAEQVALFRGLPLYPQPASLIEEVGEGLRTNMRPVFEAVAHRNPYPREFFDQHRWNHMVLKALFVESALAPIQGLAARTNPELSLILRDYARERRAAGRPVSPELWRCLAPFAAEADALGDLAQALTSLDAAERDAAVAAREQISIRSSHPIG
jgi:hypothetical protein